MQFEDMGIVISIKKFQERALIINCFTQNHGLIKGLIRYQSSKNPLNICNIININYHARLPEHLGIIKHEILSNPIALLAFHKISILTINSMLSMAQAALNEFETQSDLYYSMLSLIGELKASTDIKNTLKHYLLFEFELLNACGFGLDLSECVATKSQENLQYISPKSGCAVSLAAGHPYHASLFSLPHIFLDTSAQLDISEYIDALDMMEYFFTHRVFRPRANNLPDARLRFRNFFKESLIAA